ncbi:conserved protein of unknown function [Tenacibaculum sp. 190130A14a]|uniref:Uncharacterized protein n=1 Tax=Tenacibaculum polynesiense TaxID=3137857 RepID=A0ABP1EVQ3_9FLAO
MAKISLFEKGQIILTNPENGFYGIAVVLSETEKTPEFHPRCHIAITPLIFDRKVEFSELNMEELKPLEFERIYNLKTEEEFSKKEICIGVYTRKNKHNFEILGKVDPEKIYDGPLPFEPLTDLEITYPIYGDTENYLGREAYINWSRKIKNTNANNV